MNHIFVGLIVLAVLVAAFTGSMGAVSDQSLESAKAAVTLALALVAQMTLWLGLMGVLKEAGVMRSVARMLKPVMTRLFPDVPAEHPAMGAMIMNLAANILGLGNAATPFGIKAMGELDTLNPRKGVATNAMALFLVINTAGVAVIPLSVVAVRASLGSKDAAGVIVPSVIGTVVSTVIAVALCKLFERLPMFAPERFPAVVGEGVRTTASEADLKEAEEASAEKPAMRGVRLLLVLAVVAALVFAAGRLFVDGEATAAAKTLFSQWVLPVLMLAIVLLGFGRQVRVYDAFIRAAKEGFQIGVMVIPYLVAILVSVGMLRASGALDAFTHFIAPATSLIGFPADAVPMALIRPLSGQGATGVMTEVMTAKGPDSFVGYLVSLINGSSETTFYVLSLYFGAVQVRAVRHTLAACLIADVFGLATSTVLCHVFFSSAA